MGEEAKPGAEVEKKFTELEGKLTEALTKLSTVTDSKEALEARIAELEANKDKTPAERGEEASLKSLEARAAELRQAKGFDTWEHVIKQAASDAKEAALEQFSIDSMYEFLEVKAAENGIKPEDLEKTLERFADRSLPPHKRVAKAYSEWQERVTFGKEKEEFEKNKKDAEAFRLGGGHGSTQAPSDASAKIQQADKSGDIGDWASVMANL